MIGYLARRVSLAVVTVTAAAVIGFFLVHLTPGSPGELILGAGATEADVAAENSRIGWDRPLLTQLADYVSGLVRGDLGTSIIDGHAIGADLVARLPVTGLIALLATVVSGAAGILLGLAAAARGGATDRVIDTISGIALSLPPFWIGVLLVYAVSIKAGLLPATGYVPLTESPGGWLASVALPVIALAIAGAAIVARTARGSLLQTLQLPHVQMLRSVGASPRRLVFVHGLRSAAIPVVSVLGVQFIALFGGSIIIENLFGLPGLGQAASNAITSHDFPAVEGVVIVAALVVVLMNLLMDVLVAGLDPRVRTR